jgi:release factor glutamine methyltransferase
VGGDAPAILRVVEQSAAYLGERGIENARLEAELLLAGVLGLKRLDLYLQFDRPLQPGELDRMRERLRRRGTREPLQYIEGRAAFRDLDLEVDRRVLIPRPETEQLVEEVLRRLAGRERPEVVDIGTGSGAIALSLATEARCGRVVATDVSGEALAVARRNLERVAPSVPVEMRQGSGYSPLAGERFDAIVSNPPYVAPEEREALQPEVVRWEPEGALFAAGGGLDVVSGLIADAGEHLRTGGFLALEIGEGQGADVREMAEVAGIFETVRILPDLAGRDRMLIAETRTG